MKPFYLYLCTLMIYVLLDLLFITLFAKSFIQKQVGNLLAVKPDWIAGLIFYFIFTAGILHFAVIPSLSLKAALRNGAFLGLLCYATYEWSIKLYWQVGPKLRARAGDRRSDLVGNPW